MKTDAAREQGLHIRRTLVRCSDANLRLVVERPLPVRDGKQVATVERRVGKADERFVTAPVMPCQQRRGKVLRRLREETVRVQIDFDALAALLDDHALIFAATGREEGRRRQLHLVAHNDHLM